MTKTVELENVEKSYPLGDHEVQALRGIDLSIDEGEFTVVMGPSGSGKSTLLNLLGCIDLPSSGTVKVCGFETSSRPEKELSVIRRDNIGFIFQAFNLIPVLSVYENVEYALMLKKTDEASRDEHIRHILDQVGLSSHMHHRPNQLSGGQRQRVAIARALVSRPKMILADEPTANLDSRTGMQILELMQKMNDIYNTTFIFATHDPDVLSFARRVIKIHDGKIESDKKTGKVGKSKPVAKKPARKGAVK